jgi:monoamine oxidase
MGDGIKIFLRFKKRFYPDFMAFGPLLKAMREEEKFVYDAAWSKDSAQSVLGLFAINEKARAYTRHGSEDKIIASFLKELNQIFNGQATQHYLDHRLQNWSAEPFIQGAYSYAVEGSKNRVITELQRPLGQKIYFAGEALSKSDQAMVQGASASAYQAIEMMSKSQES